MKQSLAQMLCCPACEGSLVADNTEERQGEIESGLLNCVKCQSSYPIERSIPRFVPAENYATSFGFQWNQFRQVQLDSYSGTDVSRIRFLNQTKWSPESLENTRVLDVGCGAGRFAEVALSFGAEVFAVDYSLAVDACWNNLGPHPQLHIIQGDVYSLPFPKRSFDDVYCFGVLQHTPNVRETVRMLAQQVRPGGRLVLDVYPHSPLNCLWPKYWLRPFTKRLPHDRLFQVVQFMVKILLPVSLVLGRCRLFGISKLKHLIPVANYERVYPLSRRQLYEWSVLDTFDMMAAAYDQPQTAETLLEWMRQAGCQTKVFRDGVLVGRGVVPQSVNRR